MTISSYDAKVNLCQLKPSRYQVCLDMYLNDVDYASVMRFIKQMSGFQSCLP